MNNRSLILIIVLAAIVGLVLFLSSQNKDKYTWYKTYKLEGDQPYDFSLFYSLLKKQSEKEVQKIDFNFEKVIKKAIEDTTDKVYTYICLSKYPVLPSEQIDLLYEFVEKGNQAFLISESIANKFLIEITGEKSNYYTITSYEKDSVNYVFEHPDLNSSKPYTFSFYYKDIREREYKTYFVKDFYFNNPNFVPIVKEQQDPNHIVSMYHTVGKGKIFFHLDLMPFTNYYMIQESGFEYVNKVIGHLKPSQIIWDLGYKRNESKGDSYISKSKSPINFILERKELAVAWYLLLSIALLFLIFGIRRLQNPIPVINYRKNTSLHFVETISSIYKNKSAYNEIAHLKMEHFLWFLRNKIGVATSRLNSDTCKEISRKTGVEEQVVSIIFDHYAYRIQGNRNVTQEDLILFNSKITNFHKKLKDEQRRKQQLRKSK